MWRFSKHIFTPFFNSVLFHFLFFVLITFYTINYTIIFFESFWSLHKSLFYIFSVCRRNGDGFDARPPPHLRRSPPESKTRYGADSRLRAPYKTWRAHVVDRTCECASASRSTRMNRRRPVPSEITNHTDVGVGRLLFASHVRQVGRATTIIIITRRRPPNVSRRTTIIIRVVHIEIYCCIAIFQNKWPRDVCCVEIEIFRKR